MRIQELWRYPVKSMAGERIETAEVTEAGIAGDRKVLVVGPGDRIITSRTPPRLLGLRATLAPDGDVLVDGKGWDDPEIAEAVRAAAGPKAHLVRYDGPSGSTSLPLLIGTDGAFEQRAWTPTPAPQHRRRRRGGATERGWPGHRLRSARHRGPRQLRSRCVMTTRTTGHPGAGPVGAPAHRVGVRGADGARLRGGHRGPDRGGRSGGAAGDRGDLAGGAHHPGEVLVDRELVGQLGVEGGHDHASLPGHDAFLPMGSWQRLDIGATPANGAWTEKGGLRVSEGDRSANLTPFVYGVLSLPPLRCILPPSRVDRRMRS